MRLRLKLTLILLAVSLIPLLATMGFAFRSLGQTASSYATSKLEGIARIQSQRVKEILDIYLERTKRLDLRTTLKGDLVSYMAKPAKSLQEKNNAALSAAKDSLLDVTEINALDLSGNVIASTDSAKIGKNFASENFFLSGKTKGSIDEVIKDNNNLLIRTSAPLLVDNKTIAVVEVISDARSIANVTKDYTGLGKTGEVFLVEADTQRNAVYLNNLRFDDQAVLKRTTIGDPVNTPILLAIAGRQVKLTSNEIIDYRRRPVFVATNYIDSAKWGVVAKIDQSEALQPANNLARLFAEIVVLTASLVITAAIIIIRRITKPIKELTEAANIWKKGDFEGQVAVKGRDEVSELAQVFNGLSSKLKGHYAELQSQVDSATKDLALQLSKSEEQNRRLDDTKRAIMNILEDLAEEKANLSKITQKDEALVNSIGDSLVVTDEYGDIIKVNPELEAMLGFSEEELIGKGIVSAIPTCTVDGIPVPPDQRAVFEALATGRTVHATYQLTRKDKSKLIAGITATPYLIDGKPAGAVDVIRDISQQAAIDKAKTEFVSLASHQLRTPLSTINWYLEMVLGGDAGRVSAEQKKYLSEVYGANQRMVTLVNSLLNVSRIDLGTFAIEPTPTDLKVTVSNVVAELQGQIQKKKMKINTSFDTKLQPYNADPKLAHIIFQNLISNSVKYTPAKGTITITIAEQPPMLMISVADNGYGIPKNQQAKIFTKLFRADNVISKDTDGTGLGLYLIKAIVEEAGGKISFSSKEDAGTTFTILLPLKGMKPREGTRGLSSVNA